ncbi:hypothetical protein L3X38_009801 [Prunus dulcis]|uniref:Uncharacterized protein n=1 Tax=Prunus dulcis TaxID=3755 RepID=A0AAD4WGT0_PRUDU|nr:hypothetical protein L3X38_009801 [Prunus dulcis]
MNVGKEANPMKDDNGMNKQNNDTVAPEVNDNSVDENFGRNERDANTEHVHNHIRSSFVGNNAKGLGPKVWSKSQKAKIADRTSLHETSIRKIQMQEGVRQQVLVRQK